MGYRSATLLTANDLISIVFSVRPHLTAGLQHSEFSSPRLYGNVSAPANSVRTPAPARSGPWFSWPSSSSAQRDNTSERPEITAHERTVVLLWTLTFKSHGAGLDFVSFYSYTHTKKKMEKWRNMLMLSKLTHKSGQIIQLIWDTAEPAVQGFARSVIWSHNLQSCQHVSEATEHLTELLQWTCSCPLLYVSHHQRFTATSLYTKQTLKHIEFLPLSCPEPSFPAWFSPE